MTCGFRIIDNLGGPLLPPDGGLFSAAIGNVFWFLWQAGPKHIWRPEARTSATISVFGYGFQMFCIVYISVDFCFFGLYDFVCITNPMSYCVVWHVFFLVFV